MQKKTQLLNLVVPLLTLLAVVGAAFGESATGVLAASPKYFYIVSALGPRYVDTLNEQTRRSTPIVADSKNNSPNNSQLWQFVPDKENDGYGYFQDKSGLVLDIRHARATAGAAVIAYTKKSSEANNQLWQFIPDGLNGGAYGYVQSKSKLVLDIPGSNSNLNTPLIASQKDQQIAPNQIWIEVPQP